jgi:hypothetical protein
MGRHKRRSWRHTLPAKKIYKKTINVPVVYTYGEGQNDFDVWELSITRAIERGGSWNWDLFGHWNGNKQRECHLCPKKLRFQSPILSNGQRNGLPASQTLKVDKNKSANILAHLFNFLNKWREVNTPKLEPIQETNWGSANILTQACPFRPYCWALLYLWIFTTWIGKEERMGKICRAIAF